MKTIVWLRYFSDTAHGLKPSIIRELLKTIAQPGVISFAGGLPAPEVFPNEQMREMLRFVLEKDLNAMQYGPTEGYCPLKDQVIRLLAKKGIQAKHENILFTCGAQQALSMIAELFVDKHDPVLVEEATYSGAVQAFRLQAPDIRTIANDPDGNLDVDNLHRQIHYQGGLPKFIYLVPTFSNPTGATIDEERRRRLVELAAGHKFLIIEDDPYYDLRYRGSNIPPLKSLPGSEAVIHLGSFSKILAPGLRLGYVVAEPEMIQQLVLLKQAVDMESSGLIQRAVAEFLARGYLDPHLVQLRKIYGERCLAMIEAMREHMPAGTKWTEPEGGMFLWAKLPETFDTSALLPEALKLKVAYIPGATFCPVSGGQNAVRLNFTNAEPPLIREGIARLGKVFAAALAGNGIR